MQVTGKIKQIYQAEQPSATFTKRDIVVTTEGTYPQHITIQFTQDKCSLLDTFQIGQDVTIDINLNGREYQDKQTGQLKYFNTIQGWKISGAQQQPAYGQQQPQQNSGFPPAYNAPQGYQQQPGQGFPQQVYGQNGNY